MGRRRGTSGEIIERRRGREYSIRVRMPPDEDHEGWHWSPKRRVSGTKAEAAEELGRYQEELLLAARGGPSSVAEYARQFQTDREEQHEQERRDAERAGAEPRYTISPATLARDEYEIRRIEENFGDIAVGDLSAADLNAAYRRLRGEGMSACSLYRLHQKLKQVMRRAVREGKAPSNPCDLVDGLRPPKPRERESLSREQASRLAADLREEERSGCVVAVWLALSTGGRRGEVLGLAWGDLDLAGRRLSYERQLDCRKERRALKTESSRRVVSISDADADFLSGWKDASSERFYGGGGVPDDAPVCADADGGWLDPNSFGKWRRTWFAAHGLGRFEETRRYVDSKGDRRVVQSKYRGFDLHSLRHTHASLLIGGGADVKTVQSRLGHANPTVTMNTYAHAIEENDRAAAEAIGRLLGG